jgi:hypothetical protein
VKRRIIVHSLEEARAAVSAAAALNVPITLESATGAAGQGGPLWWKALIAEAMRGNAGAAVEAVLDCGDEPGMVMGALRAGLKRVRFTGAGEVRDKLAQIAAALGAEIDGGAAGEALDLSAARDPARACRAFLARNKTED